MAQKYIPPTQGRTGQIFDVVCLLVMVFLVLFLPVWLNIAVPSRVRVLPQGVQLTEAADADGNVTQTWTGLTWEAIGQNPTMQERWQALGYSLEGAADIAITGIVILGYFLFVLVMSKREYKDVIAEKFE
jgi:ABC-type Fe3+ transport system permease subunit